jgi:AraC family cel operon transcriptional repressor
VDGRITHVANGQRDLRVPGTLVFVRPDDVHALRPYESEAAHFINLEIKRATVSALFGYLGEAFVPRRLLDATHPPRRLLAADQKVELERRLNALNALPREDIGRGTLALRTLLFDIHARYFAPEYLGAGRDEPGWLTRTCEAMREPENLVRGLERLIELSGRSHEYVCRAFRRHLGTTPSSYVNELRLNYAANLLRHTERPIADIIFGAGYNDVAYFYRLFRQRYQRTPLEFREDRVG